MVYYSNECAFEDTKIEGGIKMGLVVIGNEGNLRVESNGAEEAGIGVLDIPTIIFHEVAKRLGGSKPPRIVPVMIGGDFTVVELDPNHSQTGFAGAVGLRVVEEAAGQVPSAEFALWATVPKGEPYDVFEPEPILRIRSSFESTGWIYGQGHNLVGYIGVKLDSGKQNWVSLTNPAVDLGIQIIRMARDLVKSGKLALQCLWEAQAWPDRDYTEP